MASTVKKRSAKASSAKKPLVSPQRKRELLGILLMALALLVTLAVLTYAPADEPLARRFSWNSLLVPGEVQASNALGLTGAAIAWVLVPGFLGYCVLLMTFSTFGWGYVWLRDRSTEFLKQVTGILFLAALLLAVGFGWLGEVLTGDFSAWSGAWGAGIARWMIQVFGTWGTFLIVLLSHVTVVLLLVDHDLQRSMDRVEHIFGTLSGRLRTQWQRRIQSRTEKKASESLSEAAARRERDRQLKAAAKAGSLIARYSGAAAEHSTNNGS